MALRTLATSHRPGASFRVVLEEGRGVRFVPLARLAGAWVPVGLGVLVDLGDLAPLACDLALYAARLATGRER